MSNALPGWYDDGAGNQRWWDGAQWTDYFLTYAPSSPRDVQEKFNTSMLGTVKWFDPETLVGMITTDSNMEVPVHRTSFPLEATPKLFPGQRVSLNLFQISQGVVADAVQVVGESSDLWRSFNGYSKSVRPSETADGGVRAPVGAKYSGRECLATVYEDSILIEHYPPDAIYIPFLFSRITAVHFEEATFWTAGIITIAVDGHPLVIPTGTNVGGDPWTVLFKKDANELFTALRDWLAQIVSINLA